ncbi:MAG: lecithin retinol acyltransferase family protein [Planctomycetales bacterium]|nr:lecithin retinol acyltransferase family protein [Planctomycetales bacterium]
MEHVGTYVPDGPEGENVVHNTKHGPRRVIWETWERFSGGGPVRIVRAAPPQERPAIMARALTQVGQPYRLFRNNCEHTAWYAQTGVRQSPQLQRAGQAVAAFALAVVESLARGVAEAAKPHPCFAVTGRGLPCKRIAGPFESHCWQHRR